MIYDVCMKIELNDMVMLLRDELLDDNYCDRLRTVVKKGTVMEVVAISPKVWVMKGKGYDNNKYFLNLELPHNHSRVRTNFCNVKKIT